MNSDRIYMCIDMKSFFASCECAELGKNPFETNLVVADKTRGSGSICLAVTPKMKSLGVRNRCRLFEIPKNIDYITAMPRMKKYIEYAADIYAVYLRYIDKNDIHVYSIDESFIDATDYLKLYNLSPREFAKKLINEIAEEKKIPATAGIGTNLYLAKIALDITAKNSPDHMGFLDEEIYRETLWNHRPITDFWQIAGGTSKRLEKLGIRDMRGIAECNPDIIYKTFGVNAELLIDHAWGKESCLISDIKNYKSRSKSLSNSQILFYDYDFEKAKLVMQEMVRTGSTELIRRKMITDNIGFFVGYSKDVIPQTNANVKMTSVTNLATVMIPYVNREFDRKVSRTTPIRRLGISFNNIADEGCEGYDMFVDFDKINKEKTLSKTIIELQDKFGKNTLVTAADLQDGATTVIRNRLIGGHNGE